MVMNQFGAIAFVTIFGVAIISVGAFKLSHLPLNGTSFSLENRISGGELAVENQFPYQVGLYIEIVAGQFAWCGGSLIDKWWILTAAHCVEKVKSVTVYLGSADRLKPKEIKVTSDVYIHEEFNSDTSENDIALLRLPSKVTFTSAIKAVNLPKKKTVVDTFVGQGAIATGWGRISDTNSAITNSLRYVIQPVISNSDCLKYYSNSLLSTHLCIDTTGGKSTCTGDSGGPLVLDDTNQELIGITSFGKSSGCTKGTPTVFTRVTSYLSWIEDVSGVDN